jgi:hypothetical protein
VAADGARAAVGNVDRWHGRQSAEISAALCSFSSTAERDWISVGNNFAFEFIQSARFEEYAAGYRELVWCNASILVANGTEVALKSALAASDTLPIVMTAIDYDPIAQKARHVIQKQTPRFRGLINDY